jgi:hypothetical protein
MEESDSLYAELLATAREFLLLLASDESPRAILSKLSTTPCPIIEEHGDSTLFPFVGHPFIGIDQVQQYSELRATHLRIDKLNLPSSCTYEKSSSSEQNDHILTDTPIRRHHEDIERMDDEIDEYQADGWIVDTNTNAVSVVAHGILTSLITRQQWDSRICYRLLLVSEKRREAELAEWKVHRVDSWADAPTVRYTPS